MRGRASATGRQTDVCVGCGRYETKVASYGRKNRRGAMDCRNLLQREEEENRERPRLAGVSACI